MTQPVPNRTASEQWWRLALLKTAEQAATSIAAQQRNTRNLAPQNGSKVNFSEEMMAIPEKTIIFARRNKKAKTWSVRLHKT